jgi:hypothetical protein
MNGMNTPTNPGWHLDRETIIAYRDGQLGPVPSASLEAHLMRCPDCRAAIAAAASETASTSQDDRWAGVADRIDVPSRRLVDRRWWVQVTVGSPMLLRSAVLLAVVLAAVPLLLAFESPRAGVAAFWAMAPVVPLAGAAIAYRREIEPAGAMAAATPMASLPLLLVRSLVVLAAAAPVSALTALLLPVPWHLLIGWLLPGIAFSAVVLAVGTRVDPTTTAAGLAMAWTSVVAASVYRWRHLDLEAQLRTSFVNGPAFQLTMVIVGCAATILYWSRRDQLTTWSPA